MGDLSENFSTEELSCKCGCGLKYPSPRLVCLLQKIRVTAGAPVNIASGWRCTEHNRKYSAIFGKQGFVKGQIGDAEASAHTRGEAADIEIKGFTKEQAYRFIMTMYARGTIPELTYCYMIKDSKANLHVGVDNYKPRSSVWGGTQ